MPEIALITQIERRFRARFGDCVGVLHSGLSAGERYDQWTRIMQGEATIVIGARSAIFAPFEDIGIIIVDEEHDSSYKQEGQLRYNARDLAVVRAQQIGCLALLGSATPSIQSYHNTVTGKFTELTLTKRVEQRSLPEISIVDLRESRDTRGIGRYVSPQLQQAMAAALEHDEQVLLFLNRRGYSSFPVCGACGQPMRCKHCDISLTLHQRSNAYRCHYCGFSRSAVSNCDICGSDKIKLLGLGTEKLEGMIAKLFPDARLARMDRDTTTRKGSVLKLLKGIRDKTTDILVGTQMVAKGHDFPNITLVGIICADLSLNFPDFRSFERSYQLMAQVAGRAGRTDGHGKVVIQTANPKHPVIQHIHTGDYHSMYMSQMEDRQVFHYPPYARLLRINLRHESREIVDRASNELAENLRKLMNVPVMGPQSPLIGKIQRMQLMNILIKLPRTARMGDHKKLIKREIDNMRTRREYHKLFIVPDVDPV